MQPSTIKAKDFKLWLDRQPDDRVWNFYSNHECVLCAYLKETNQATNVYAGGWTVTIDGVEIDIPQWLQNILATFVGPDFVTAKELKQNFASLGSANKPTTTHE